MTNKNHTFFAIGLIIGIVAADIVATEIIKRIGVINTYSGHFQCIKK